MWDHRNPRKRAEWSVKARLVVNENADKVNGYQRHCSCCEWQLLALGDAFSGSAAPPFGQVMLHRLNIPHTTLLPSTHTGNCQYAYYKTWFVETAKISESQTIIHKVVFLFVLDESFVSSCLLFHSSGWLSEQWRDHEEASIHQRGWGGIGVRGWTLPSPQGTSPGQAGPRPALPPALPSALPAAACKDRPTSGRSRPARQPADPCGELQLHAAGPQPSVRSHSCIHSVVVTQCGNLTCILCLALLLYYS